MTWVMMLFVNQINNTNNFLVCVTRQHESWSSKKVQSYEGSSARTSRCGRLLDQICYTAQGSPTSPLSCVHHDLVSTAQQWWNIIVNVQSNQCEKNTEFPSDFVISQYHNSLMWEITKSVGNSLFFPHNMQNNQCGR